MQNVKKCVGGNTFWCLANVMCTLAKKRFPQLLYSFCKSNLESLIEFFKHISNIRWP